MQQNHNLSSQQPQPINTDLPSQQQQQQQQQFPQHFYDSDIASVCQKDFLSDHQPPKDIIQQRKLLYKQKFLHVFKTIIRIGDGIDRPARFDKVQLKWKEVPKDEIIERKKYIKENKKENNNNDNNNIDKNIKGKQNFKENVQEKQIIYEQSQQKQTDKVNNNQNQQPNHHQTQYQSNPQQPHSQSHPSSSSQPQLTHPFPSYFSTQYLSSSLTLKYNLGFNYQQIQRFVTSMKRGQTALFQLQHLQLSKKSNIKIKKYTEIHLIHVYDWVTVIDLSDDKKLLKQVLKKGQGAFRVNYYDQIKLDYQIKIKNYVIIKEMFDDIKFQKQFVQKKLGKVMWRVISSMKDKEEVRLEVKFEDYKQYQQQNNQEVYNEFIENYRKVIKQQQNLQQLPQNDTILTISVNVHQLIKIDDIYLDGRILKKPLIKGVSTAKPQSSSLVYYALKFINYQQNDQLIKQDPCFDSDWWQDFQKLELLQGIRKNYLDDYSVSKMLKATIKRMKPAEIAEIQCRDTENLFKFGSDYNQLIQLFNYNSQNKPIPSKIKLIIRVYNFTQGRNAFNMQIQQKILESRRKKAIATKLLQQGNLKKALKRFSNIIAFYSSQKINQQAYDQKISALMNSVLCHMKLKNFIEVITLCDQILKKPRHGHQVKDLTIHGPGNAKIQGNIPRQQQGQGQLQQGSTDTRRIAKDLVQNGKILDKCMYRKAWALVSLGQCQQAINVMDGISEENKNSDEVVKLKQQAVKGKEKYQNKSKKMFKNMFGK